MDPFVGQISLFTYSKVINGWALCNGQTMQINQNLALYSLIGIHFGGDGKATFNLPDLRGRTPVNVATQPVTQGSHPTPTPYYFNIGDNGGAETVALKDTQLPAHSHSMSGMATAANKGAPIGNRFLAKPSGVWTKGGGVINLYGPATNLVGLGAASIQNTGGGQGHNNMQPSLALAFSIALLGFFPPRS